MTRLLVRRRTSETAQSGSGWPPTLSGYLKQFVHRETANWVAVILDEAGSSSWTDRVLLQHAAVMSPRTDECGP